jgi:hypothetical protein
MQICVLFNAVTIVLSVMSVYTVYTATPMIQNSFIKVKRNIKKIVKAHLQVENKPGFCQKPGLYTRD